ncbi:2',3'-cyclic-nucleotide 2'-phosphodiesterase/3'-nucleotidase [Enterococcus sp. DIV0212c]|uniref:bifunctional metallophosphatase/5'-nucleotidase n=1 Tax=Enterococcus sp. DIV0212c TaxID=2230867 RepID=UPI001A9B5E65|nr:metallophosphoesterase [Enterococcus sp. DIV0212c]MBO1354300.1 metallophosphoesterase [Enterococcus sp. DIV0212c]
MDELTILSTTDVHGFLTASGNEESGICSLPAIAGNYHEPILIDNGDFLVGSPQTTFFNTTTAVSPLIELANQLGFDVMVPGNHDFDYGIEFLKRQVAAFEGNYLCANVLDLNNQQIFDPYTIIERGSLKVGIIGVITSAMPQITDYNQIKELKFINVIETLKHWVPLVREKVDVLIVSYHGGIERDMLTGQPTQYDTGEDQTYRIISEMTGIDGIICGHQHRNNAGILENTAFVQPGYRGNYIGELTFSMQDKQIIDKKACLISTEKYPVTSYQLYDETKYNNWLQEELDLSKFDHYLAKKVPGTFYAVKLKGRTIGDFLASFMPPYTLSTYHVSNSELKELILSNTVQGITMRDGQLLPDQSDYRVTTNKTIFPDYRLENNYIYNVFDEYISSVNRLTK